MNCPHCHSPIGDPHASFCDHCGTALSRDNASPVMPGVTLCSSCGHQNFPGTLSCAKCGVQLPPVVMPPPPPPVLFLHTNPSSVSSAFSARFVDLTANTVIPLPSGKPEIVIGREDVAGEVFPDVDLNPYQGDEKGVSRRQARLWLQGEQVFLEDLNSTNFTYINRQKLLPGQRYLLNNGDEVQFGRLLLKYLS